MKQTFYQVLVNLILVFGVSEVYGEVEPPSSYRLPNDTFPLRYDVTLSIDLVRASFTGTVLIDLRANRNTDRVTLNVRDLDILSTELSFNDGGRIRIVDSVTVNVSQQVTFTVDGELIANGDYKFAIDFAGTISNDLKGLYKSSYYRESEERFIATTFNAAAYARKIFPCYDEPQLKATFKLRIYHDRELHALSNMPVEKRTESANAQGMSLTVFEESPRMSSYLVAFVVSDFGVRQLDSVFGAYAQESVLSSVSYALNFTRTAIEHLGKAFKRPYQLAKLDIVAVDDFLMGAMENWGLITYKTSRIVYREDFDKTAKLQSVTKIVFHELIHQWFGNEVTCAWWTYVWLNEGFAVFLETYILDKMHPDWHLMDQFLVNDMHSVMEKDIIPGTRSMSDLSIQTPEQIEGIYDFVVYPKAASIIRMISSIVGLDVFDDFLVQYLADRSFEASTEDDLIRVLQANVYKHKLQLPAISTIIRSWTSNPSFPLITMNRDYSRNILEFSAHPPKTFYIPLHFVSKTHSSELNWLPSTEASITINLNNIKSSDWILLNPNQTGYYRVNYDTQNWNLLSQALKQNHTQIPKLSRAQLIDDCLYFVRHNLLQIEILMDILSYLPHETELVPLKAGFKAIRTLNRLVRGHELESSYLGMQRKILDRVYETMPSNTSADHISKLYRYEVRKVACELGVQRCLQNAIEHFEGFELIEADLRPAVLCGSMKSSQSTTVWTMIVKRLTFIVRNFEQKRVNLEEFEDILYGLGCFTSQEEATNLLVLSLSRTNVLESSDRVKMFNFMANSGVNGTDEALRVLKDEYDTLKRNYGSLQEVVSNLRYAISTPQQLQRLDEIIQTNTDPEVSSTLQEVYLEATQNVQWTQKNLPIIAKWISDNENAAASIALSNCLVFLLIITHLLNVSQ